MNPSKLKMGLIGGGGAGFIGRVHVTAATLDREAELVAGAFSSSPEKSKRCAAEFSVSPARAYGSYSDLLSSENRLPSNDRIDFVTIATPNHTHADIAICALKSGFHVICDKPMTTNLDDARRLVETVSETGKVFVLSHNYSGYPMVRQAREMIRNGEIGEVLAIRVAYKQGWMHGMQAGITPNRGAWKSDPLKNGPAGSLGDVGTHAFHLLSFITGLKPTALMCKLKSFSSHHNLDDYGQAIMQMSGDTMATVMWSQVSHGRLNDLSIQIDGSKGALSWRQESPNQLIFGQLGKPTMTYDRHPSADYTTPDAKIASRLPAGHPEAFFEAFANLYRDAYRKMRCLTASKEPQLDGVTDLCPSVWDGFDGVLFTHHCLNSNARGCSWVNWCEDQE